MGRSSDGADGAYGADCAHGVGGAEVADGVEGAYGAEGVDGAKVAESAPLAFFVVVDPGGPQRSDGADGAPPLPF